MRLYLWTSPANIKWKALPAYQGLYLKPDCILLCFFLFLLLRPMTTSILPSSQPNCKEDRVQSWGQSCFPWMFRSDLYSRLLFWGEHFLSNIFYAPTVVFKEMKASFFFFLKTQSQMSQGKFFSGLWVFFFFLTLGWISGCTHVEDRMLSCWV